MPVTLTGADMAPISISVGLYSDNTPMVKIDNWDEVCEKVDIVTYQHSSLNEFMATMFLVEAMFYNGARDLKLVIPYLPGARQDRSNPEGDVLFTAKSVATQINRKHFTKVVYVDAHSPVMENELRSAHGYPLNHIAFQLSGEYDGIISPDAGARERAKVFANQLEVPLYQGRKHRDPATGALSGFEINVPPGHYLVVDDICDGGGTFMGLKDAMGTDATADLYVTHGIFAKGALDRLLTRYDKVITTDSLPNDRTKNLEIIKIVEEMRNF